MPEAIAVTRLAGVLSEIKPKPRVDERDLVHTLVAARNDLDLAASDSSDEEVRAAAQRISELADAAKAGVGEPRVIEADSGLFSLDATASVATPFPGLASPRRGLVDRLTLGPFVDAGGLDRLFGLLPRTTWQQLAFEDGSTPLFLFARRQRG